MQTSFYLPLDELSLNIDFFGLMWPLHWYLCPITRRNSVEGLVWIDLLILGLVELVIPFLILSLLMNVDSYSILLQVDTYFSRLPNGRVLCSLCRKDFVSCYQFRRHFRTHTGEKPFQCFFCSYSSNQKGNLLQHCFNHHQVDKEQFIVLCSKKDYWSWKIWEIKLCSLCFKQKLKAVLPVRCIITDIVM